MQTYANFYYYKAFFGLWSPNTSRFKKDQKTKNVPLDESYLEYGLRFELEFFIWAPEPKN